MGYDWFKEHDREFDEALARIYRLHAIGHKAGLLRQELVLIAGEPGCHEITGEAKISLPDCNCRTCVQASIELVLLKKEIEEEVAGMEARGDFKEED